MNQFICSKCGCSTIREVTTQVTQYRYFVVDDMGELECVEDDFESTGYTTYECADCYKALPATNIDELGAYLEDEECEDVDAQSLS